MERDDLGIERNTEYANFNSRAHVERDLQKTKQHSNPKGFQLTRSRGARLQMRLGAEAKRRFQLTRSRGARQNTANIMRFRRVFQLTRSRGARLFCFQTKTRPHSRFQLTRSRGARPARFRTRLLMIWKFQLTRSRGARQKTPTIATLTAVFQLTRSRGARRYNDVFLHWK